VRKGGNRERSPTPSAAKREDGIQLKPTSTAAQGKGGIGERRRAPPAISCVHKRRKKKWKDSKPNIVLVRKGGRHEGKKKVSEPFAGIVVSTDAQVGREEKLKGEREKDGISTIVYMHSKILKWEGKKEEGQGEKGGKKYLKTQQLFL